MRTRSHPILLAALLAAAFPARAGTVLKWYEATRLEGKPAHRTVVAYSSELGLRMQIVEVGGPVESAPGASVLLWVAGTGALHVKEGSKEWVTVTPALVSSLRSKGERRGKPPVLPAPPVTVKKTGSRHTVNSFPCEAYTLQQKGFPTRIVCLGNPGPIGIDETTRRNFREMSRLLASFMELADQAGGGAPAPDEGIRYNTYDMPGGFPIRAWEARRGETWLDSELVSVAPGETPPSLFEPPAAPSGTAGPSAPPVTPAAPPRSGR